MVNFDCGCELGSVTANYAFRLDLRFLSGTLNRQVKANGFCDCRLLIILRKNAMPNFISGNPGYQYVDWWTHKVKGLHLNDFIMDSQIDQVYQ